MDTPKQQVRDFYDEVGWAQEADGLFQNARFEDLRPVSREYIHRCHMRVNRHLSVSGELFLDAGSGPVQWPEYLTYSSGYSHRVCVDISITALRAAQEKLGPHGLCIVGDLASLPFKAGTFDAIVSMHAIQHLPVREHALAFRELIRVLSPGGSAVAINGWYRPMFMRLAEPLIGLGRLLSGRNRKSRKRDRKDVDAREVTFVQKMTPARLRSELGDTLPYEVFTWRSSAPEFMQWFVRERFGGRILLRLIFRLEEMFPRFFGLHGQYPMIVLRKPAVSDEASQSTAVTRPHRQRTLG